MYDDYFMKNEKSNLYFVWRVSDRKTCINKVPRTPIIYHPLINLYKIDGSDLDTCENMFLKTTKLGKQI